MRIVHHASRGNVDNLCTVFAKLQEDGRWQVPYWLRVMFMFAYTEKELQAMRQQAERRG